MGKGTIQCERDYILEKAIPKKASRLAIQGYIERLEAENATLRKDKERLDWAQALMMERRELNLVPQTNDLGECSVTIEVFRPPVTTHSKRTVRAAIDAAMEEGK